MLTKTYPIRKKKLVIPSLVRISPNIILAFLIGCSVGAFLYPSFNETKIPPLASTEKASIQACFSPEGKCTHQVVSAIEGARSSILVMAYSFTCPQIASALVKAFERGADVKILIDKSQLHDKHSQLSFLSQNAIPIFIDPAVGIAHNKTMILDDHYVLTGSFNWSRAASSKNAENILLIDDPSLAQLYKKNWEKRAATARRVKS